MRKRIINSKEEKNSIEEMILKWKKSNFETRHIIKYEDHWYECNNNNEINGKNNKNEENKEYLLILTEYVGKRSLFSEIEKKKTNNIKFKESVYVCVLF
jgi:hypothetical protein